MSKRSLFSRSSKGDEEEERLVLRDWAARSIGDHRLCKKTLNPSCLSSWLYSESQLAATSVTAATVGKLGMTSFVVRVASVRSLFVACLLVEERNRRDSAKKTFCSHVLSLPNACEQARIIITR